MNPKKKKILVLTSFNAGNNIWNYARIFAKNPEWEVKFLCTGKLTSHDSKAFQSPDEEYPWDEEQRFHALSGFNKLKSLIDMVKWADYVFVNYRIAFLPFLLRKKYFYISTGTDFDSQIFDFREAKNIILDMIRLNVTLRALRKMFTFPLFMLKEYITAGLPLYFAIKHSTLVFVVPYQRPKLIRKFRGAVSGFVPHFIPYFGDEAYLRDFTGEEKRRIQNEVKSEMGCNRLFISITRHVWGSDVRSIADNKGNDVVIKVFDMFLRSQVEPNTVLILIEKGPHVDRTKALARQLGVDSKVVWLKERPRNQLFKYIAGADVLFEQFNIGCFTFGSLEAMVCRTAVFSYIGDTTNNDEFPFYSEPPVVFNSKNPDTIATRLIELMTNPGLLDSVQDEGAAWAWRHCNDTAVIETFDAMLRKMDKLHLKRMGEHGGKKGGVLQA